MNESIHIATEPNINEVMTFEKLFSTARRFHQSFKSFGRTQPLYPTYVSGSELRKAETSNRSVLRISSLDRRNPSFSWSNVA